jgi:hypothetical protein
MSRERRVARDRQIVDLSMSAIIADECFVDERHLPMQLRDPAENGMNEKGERPSADDVPLLANRDGSNRSGSAKTLGS